MQRPVLLCGLGKVGWRVLEFLRATGVPLAVVDLNASPDDPRLAGVRYFKGDCRQQAALEAVGVAEVRGVLILTSDDLVNVSSALLVRRLNPECRIVVRMFNQNLIHRFGAAIRNTTALSVSGLAAPLLALSALTGESLGAFKLDSGPHQISEVVAEEGSNLIGRRLTEISREFKLLILAHLPAGGEPLMLHTVEGDRQVARGDRLVVCGTPAHLEALLASGHVDLLVGVRWAGFLRRTGRTIRRTLGAVDLSMKLAAASLFLTLFFSTLIFRYGVGSDWADGLYRTVTIVATGSDLGGQNTPAWVKVFLSILKIAGAALMAAFTAIFTNYLLRAKLGGALEVRKIPDGGHVVVCGLGNVGFRCVEELVRLNLPVVALDRVADNPFAATVRRMGIPVVIGDATVPEVLRQVRAESARAVVAATSSELANLEIALLVREGNPTQRVVVRLTDADFAQAVRTAADIKLAVSIPALAAPAFAAALFGDRVHTLLFVGGRSLAVVELAVQPHDQCLHGCSLVAAMIDYGLLPIAVSGQEPFASIGIPLTYRLKNGDRLTAVMAISDLERLLRREPPATNWEVVVDSHPTATAGSLLLLVRTARGCSHEAAEALLKQPSFTLASGLTRGGAEDLLVLMSKERVKARVVEN